jgi:hypothetical protein
MTRLGMQANGSLRRSHRGGFTTSSILTPNHKGAASPGQAESRRSRHENGSSDNPPNVGMDAMPRRRLVIVLESTIFTQRLLITRRRTPLSSFIVIV